MRLKFLLSKHYRSKSMLARNIKPATRAVLDVTDKRALGAAKRSLVIMSEALNIPVTNFPKPTMEAIRHFDGEL